MVSSITKTRTVILFGQGDLLARSIEIFLSSREEWEVMHIVDKTAQDLIREITQVKPDVVVLCREDSSNNEDLPWQLLQLSGQLKVIVIGAENNELDVYSKEGLCVQEVADLLNAIGS